MLAFLSIDDSFRFIRSWNGLPIAVAVLIITKYSLFKILIRFVESIIFTYNSEIFFSSTLKFFPSISSRNQQCLGNSCTVIFWKLSIDLCEIYEYSFDFPRNTLKPLSIPWSNTRSRYVFISWLASIFSRDLIAAS